jgi:hypothetical protein
MIAPRLTGAHDVVLALLDWHRRDASSSRSSSRQCRARPSSWDTTARRSDRLE